MSRRKVYDDEGHAYFITFSCYHRRRLLDQPQMRDVVVEVLAGSLEKRGGICSGYIVMPDHVHSIVWFPEPGTLSAFMKAWKQASSLRLKRLVRGSLSHYSATISRDDPFWQAKYYPFNLYSTAKAREKLDYMHTNPVAAGLVSQAVDWPHGSARFYLLGEDVGVPIQWIFD